MLCRNYTVCIASVHCSSRMATITAVFLQVDVACTIVAILRQLMQFARAPRTVPDALRPFRSWKTTLLIKPNKADGLAVLSLVRRPMTIAAIGRAELDSEESQVRRRMAVCLRTIARVNARNGSFTDVLLESVSSIGTWRHVDAVAGYNAVI